jgi:hypothetical protein
MDVERPNKIRALMQSARSEREIIYDGKTATLFTPRAEVLLDGGVHRAIGELIGKLEERDGVEMPLSDLLLFGTPAAALDKIASAMLNWYSSGSSAPEGRIASQTQGEKR